MGGMGWKFLVFDSEHLHVFFCGACPLGNWAMQAELVPVPGEIQSHSYLPGPSLTSSGSSQKAASASGPGWQHPEFSVVTRRKGGDGDICSFIFMDLIQPREVEYKLVGSMGLGNRGMWLWTLTWLLAGFLILGKSQPWFPRLQNRG